MCTIYENIRQLCEAKGIRPGKMCTDIGMSKSILTGLKNGTKKNIQTDTAQKIADYFDVSVDRVLGTEQKENPAAGSSEVFSDNQKKAMNLIAKMTDAQLEAFIAVAEQMLNAKD